MNSDLLEIHSDTAPPLSVSRSYTIFARPASYAPASSDADVMDVACTIVDGRDPRTLGDVLARARAVETVSGTEARIMFARDAAGRITGVLFGTKVTP